MVAEWMGGRGGMDLGHYSVLTTTFARLYLSLLKMADVLG